MQLVHAHEAMVNLFQSLFIIIAAIPIPFEILSSLTDEEWQ
jgi:hypothetical protein